MAQRYESISEILSALRKRRIQVSREVVEAGLRRLDLREPFGPGDLDELVAYLGPQHTVNHRIIRTERVLASQEWADAVLAVRLESGLPPNGLPEREARAIHTALMDTLAGRPTVASVGTRRRQPMSRFWQELIAGSRRLCTLLRIDPRPLDDLRAAYARGVAGTLFGVRKLLDPGSVFELDGQELPYRPNQTDRLVGHVLWNLPLDSRTMEPKPSVTYQWLRLEDGSGRFIPHIFNEKEATPAELRDLKTKLQEIKRVFRDGLLLAIETPGAWQGLSWDERWQRWNQLYPDFAVQSPGALRKAYAYAVKTRAQIQARYEKLARLDQAAGDQRSP